MWRRALLFGDARTTDGLPAHRLIFLTISPAYYAQRRQLSAFTRVSVKLQPHSAPSNELQPDTPHILVFSFVTCNFLSASGQNVVRWVSFEGGEYENVVRVKLAILGFAKANELAQKLNTLLRVCSGLFECHKFFHNGKHVQIKYILYYL